ncbi:Hypothetical protein RMHFA_01841 [Roseomonas mucosa]|nr:Hypothetical protein RMHFA_01841 [Roseomonas mucosa]GAV35187.1 hypothetical protein ROTAS13_02859 [Roseomonas sp. TAS13]
MVHPACLSPGVPTLLPFRPAFSAAHAVMRLAAPLATLALVAGCVPPPQPLPAMPPHASRQPYPPIPALRVEPEPPRLPGAEYVWQPGHWQWDGVAYRWEPGRYVLRHIVGGGTWRHGEWVWTRGGWAWEPGGWR